MKILSNDCNLWADCLERTTYAQDLFGPNVWLDPYGCSGDMWSEAKYCLEVCEYASQILSNNHREYHPSSTHPRCRITLTASLVPYSINIWIIFATGQVKRGGKCSAVAFKKVSVTMRPIFKLLLNYPVAFLPVIPISYFASTILKWAFRHIERPLGFSHALLLYDWLL